MLITRPDAAIFYSESDGADGSWEFSHCVEAFDPLKPCRLVRRALPAEHDHSSDSSDR